MVRVITDEEAQALRWRHPFNFMWYGGDTRYIEDEVLGVVLIFERADGVVLHIQTDLPADPSSQDPNTVAYVTSETLKAVGESATGVMVETLSLLKVAAVAAIAYFGYRIMKGSK